MEANYFARMALDEYRAGDWYMANLHWEKAKECLNESLQGNHNESSDNAA